MIAIHLCKANYQAFLIICQESLIKNAKNAMKEKKLGQNVNLLDLEIIDSTKDTKNAMKQLKELKIFRICLNFAMVSLIIFFFNFVFSFLFFCVYPYEYMNNREKFDETSILPKEAFYSKLNEEGISDADYARIKKTWEVFEIRNLS